MGMKRFFCSSVSKLKTRAATPITLGSIIAAALTLFCFAVIAAIPIVRDGGSYWPKPEDWGNALRITWPAIAAAAFLKFGEKFKRKSLLSRRHRARSMMRKLQTSAAIVELYRNLGANKLGANEMRGCRETILACVASHVEDVLGLLDSDCVSAALLDFSDGDHKMCVTARAPSGRQVPKTYERENLVAWHAIDRGCLEVVDDVRGDPRWSQVDNRPYRSVFAIPVVSDNRAFGAISLDLKKPYAFFGRAQEIAVGLTPYIAVLAMTYQSTSVSEECKYDSSYLIQR